MVGTNDIQNVTDCFCFNYVGDVIDVLTACMDSRITQNILCEYFLSVLFLLTIVTGSYSYFYN